MQIMLHARRFDAASWRAGDHNPSDGWPTRLRMVDDLTLRHHLLGLRRDELITLLGKPDDITAFQGRSRRSENATWDVGYELGPERSPIVRIDNDWLLFDLDASGRVQRFIVTHD
jgi:hypothetical protein